MKHEDDENHKELSLGMISRGGRGSAWLQAAALAFAVTGCALDDDPSLAQQSAAVSAAGVIIVDCKDNPDNPVCKCPIISIFGLTTDNPDCPDNPVNPAPAEETAIDEAPIAETPAEPAAP